MMSEDIENINNELWFKDRDSNTSGQKGYKIVRLGFDWTSIPISYANSTWEIRYDFDLAGLSVTLPENVTLKFNGGVLKNATQLVGDNTNVKAENDATVLLNNSYSGTWKIYEIYPEWFGAIGDDTADDTNAIKDALNFASDFGATLCLLSKVYKTTSQITIQKTGFKNSTLSIKGYPFRSFIKPYLSSGYALVFDGGQQELPVVIDGLSIDGTAAMGTTSGIMLNRNQSSNISNLYILSLPETGFRLSENWNILINNLEVRNCGGIGIHLEADNTSSHLTTSEINNITFVGGTSSNNDTGIQISSDGGVTKCENLAFYGLNTANISKGWQVFNTDESIFDTVYLEQQLSAVNQMYFKDSRLCEIRSPHVTANKNIFKVESCNHLKFNTLLQQSSITSNDIILEVIDSEIKVENWNVTGGNQGTFCKYIQNAPNRVHIIFDFVRAIGFANTFDETLTDGIKTIIQMYNCEGILPTDIRNDARAGGIDRNGYVYLGPSSNKIARLGNSSTFGGTEQGWIEVDQEGGAKGYIRVYSSK